MNNKIKFALKRYLDLKSYVDTDMIDYCADCKDVFQYCANDVRATEKVFDHLKRCRDSNVR